MNEIMITSVVIWSAIILITLIIELSTFGIYSSLITISAIPSLFISIFSKPGLTSILVEIVLFIVLSSLLIVLFYFFGKKLLKTKYQGPILELIGQTTDLLVDSRKQPKTIEEYGKVYVNGKTFRTIPVENIDFIKQGTKVEIVRIEGNTLFIQPVKGA
ncbi:hypothetical protein HUN03_00445 [Mycoplasmopsis anatis]|uniref:NfeD-like C-terminal domain-containing protein n=1 Tax=Mycoplasmopsis anatis TaxID=171279 RepID=A0A9Q3LAK5_9BACT|nr:NfeD family protein [Mycoplasmopsis anatis]MBW0594839.1 hypothetical protein [Mycoplasmopsis anatis]MBW0595620.1 hypothetical protein [Mycoplasmopsis anatis]MBW0596855.1 hypothetical protein [Mycoplasmopsis anatis]MBW0597611.1 hypothetical protein [Mycoplasmopsis anatis]MBW0598430.1 hypothetical protein [Mycoplasmopsis anatis]